MKHLIIILIIIAGFVGCDYDDILLQEKEIEVGNIYDYDFEGSEEIPEFETIDGYFKWVNNNRKYDSSVPDDYVQTPQETYYNIDETSGKMKGDCKAFSLLFSSIIDIRLNIYSELIFYKNGNQNHVVVYIPSVNKYYDPTCNSEYDIIKKEIIDRIPYSQAIWMAVNYHGYID